MTLSMGAIVAFVIYYRFANQLYLEHLASTGIALSLQWEFELENCVTAVVFGIISAGLCVTAIVMIGIFRQVFNRIRDRLDGRGLPGTIIAPLIGGIAVGCISWVLPLTIGDGNMTLPSIVKLTFEQVEATAQGSSTTVYITAHLLTCSVFAKMFALAVSMNCGFVGGFVFPMITIGAMAGSVASLLYPAQPIGFCIGAFMAAVPAGICPMPFTLLCISVFCLYFGLYQTVPLFIAVITSYLLVCGSGLFRALADRGESAAAERAKQLEEMRKAKSNVESSSQSNPLTSHSTDSTDTDPRYFQSSQYQQTKRPVAPRASETDDLTSDV